MLFNILGIFRRNASIATPLYINYLYENGNELRLYDSGTVMVVQAVGINNLKTSFRQSDREYGNLIRELAGYFDAKQIKTPKGFEFFDKYRSKTEDSSVRRILRFFPKTTK